MPANSNPTTTTTTTTTTTSKTRQEIESFITQLDQEISNGLNRPLTPEQIHELQKLVATKNALLWVTSKVDMVISKGKLVKSDRKVGEE